MMQTKLGMQKNKMKKIYITKPVMVADVVNQNGRIYSRSVLEKMVADFNEEYPPESKFNSLLGELDQPCDGANAINLDRVSHKIIELFFEDDTVMAKVKVLDTPMGNILKTLATEVLDNITLQMRGTGVLHDTGYVNDFNLITVDVCPIKQGRKQTDEEWFENVMNQMAKDKLI